MKVRNNAFRKREFFATLNSTHIHHFLQSKEVVKMNNEKIKVNFHHENIFFLTPNSYQNNLYFRYRTKNSKKVHPRPSF